MTHEPVIAREPDEAKFYTIAEAMKILKVSEHTIRKAIEDGTIPHVRVGSKTIRIPANGLHELGQPT